MLEFNDVQVGHETMLFSIPKLKLDLGEFVALIGKNGAGKSTLLEALIHGKYYSGEIKLNNHLWGSTKLQERSKQITLVDNHFLGEDYLSVREYLELGRHAFTNLLGRLSHEDKEVVRKYVDLLHLESLLNQSTSTLSDGERQRVGIARALIQETPVVLLDEPTAFLDYPTKREVMQLLRDIAKNQNRLIIVASHDIEFCVEYGSRLLILENNKKVLNSYQNISQELLISLAFGSEI